MALVRVAGDVLEHWARAKDTSRGTQKQDFSGQNLTNADFSGQNLAGASFLGTNLRNAILSGATLTKADLKGLVEGLTAEQTGRGTVRAARPS